MVDVSGERLCHKYRIDIVMEMIIGPSSETGRKVGIKNGIHVEQYLKN